jgi:predicted PurR-regulated permease PerM
VAEQRIKFDISVKSVMTVAFSLILLALIYYVRDILVLLLISFILATALEPTVDWFEKKRIPRIFTMAGVYALILLIIYTLVRLVSPLISEQIVA